MSAGSGIAEALAEALQNVTGLTGTFDGPPPRAAFPYAVIDTGNESDWSHKSGRGREIKIALTLWDDQPVRLAALADEAESALESVAAVTGWKLVAMQFLKRQTVRDVAGPWAVAIDYRARLLAD